MKRVRYIIWKVSTLIEDYLEPDSCTSIVPGEDDNHDVYDWAHCIQLNGHPGFHKNTEGYIWK